MNYKGLIVGLGNPGPEYALTRHNAGFMAVDWMLEQAARRKSLKLERVESGDDCEVWRLYPAGMQKGPYLMAKPLTYMNLSGLVAARLCGRHNLDARDVLVIHDELDLEPGRAKLKRGGGANGHNGVISIEERLGDGNFIRARIGIGRPEHATQMVEYVLEPFSARDLELTGMVVKEVWKAFDLMLRRGWNSAVQHLHGYRADLEDDGKSANGTGSGSKE